MEQIKLLLYKLRFEHDCLDKRFDDAINSAHPEMELQVYFDEPRTIFVQFVFEEFRKLALVLKANHGITNEPILNFFLTIKD